MQMFGLFCLVAQKLAKFLNAIEVPVATLQVLEECRYELLNN